MPFNILSAADWAGFKDLPAHEPDLLVDTARIQAKLDARRNNPLRWHVMTFRVPLGASKAQKEELVKDAIGRWVNIMRKRVGKLSWELHGDVHIRGPFRAVDLRSNAVLLGEREYRVRAVFRIVGEPTPIRIEYPKEVVRQDPDQTITSKQAARAYGISLPA